jgi:hypothetical protein
MSLFPFLVPTSYSAVTEPFSVPAFASYGTNFSVYGVGGFMEVYYLSELSFSSRTIPIEYDTDGNGNLISVILNDDNISSGRRKLGMLVYVYETNTTYQFTIPNYLTTFNLATGTTPNQLRCVVPIQNKTVVSVGCSGYTELLISGWTGSSIEGVSGVTRNNASWIIFVGSGGTSPSGDFVFRSGDTMTGQLNAPSIYSPIIYLGNDSSGNTRTLTADDSIFDFDILDGGDY